MKKKLTAVVLLVFMLFTVAFVATACNHYNKNVTVQTESYYGYTDYVLTYTLKVKSGTVYEVQFTVYYLEGTARKTKTLTETGEWTAEDSPYQITYQGSIEGEVTITKVVANVTSTNSSNIAYAIVPAGLAFGALVWLVVALVLTLMPKRNKAEKAAEPNESGAEQADGGAATEESAPKTDSAAADDNETPADK